LITAGRQPPTFIEEEILKGEGYRNIAGVDEAGRGPLAGPVVAAAVILPHGIENRWLKKVRDSKQLTGATRELLFKNIRADAAGIGVGCVESALIDEAGIVTSRISAQMRRELVLVVWNLR